MSHSYNERGTLMISFSQLLEKDHGEILSRKRRVRERRECHLHPHQHHHAAIQLEPAGQVPGPVPIPSRSPARAAEPAQPQAFPAQVRRLVAPGPQHHLHRGSRLLASRTWDIGQGASTGAATGVLQALDSRHFQQELKALDSFLATAQPKNGLNVTWQRNDINL